MAIAPNFTTDATYMLQIADRDGDWNWYSQTEYDSEAAVRELAGQMYGGLKEDEYRVIRVERQIL